MYFCKMYTKQTKKRAILMFTSNFESKVENYMLYNKLYIGVALLKAGILITPKNIIMNFDFCLLIMLRTTICLFLEIQLPM